MTFRARLALAVAALAACSGATGARADAGAYEVTDALGTQVSFTHAPARIVTLAPSLGELAADVAGEHLEKIVGVSEYTDYPPALKHVATIGPYNHVNLELIASLKPDLVLATRDGNVKDQIEHLRELGISVVVVATDSFDGVASSMKLVATAMGDAASGARMADEFAAGLARVRARAQARGQTGATARAGTARARVLLQLGDEPLIVVGKRGFLNDALGAIGADNAYGNLDDAYPRPALEDAITRDPDTILILAMGPDETPFRQMAAHWARFPKLAAVKKGRVRILHADELLRPSMRLLEGLSLLEKTVYGTP